MTCMTPNQFQNAIVGPALDLMAEVFDRPSLADDLAIAILVAIACQESDLKHRRQVPVAYAKGYWQFERGTAASRAGVYGVMTHKQTGPMMKRWCEVLSVRHGSYAELMESAPLTLGRHYHGMIENHDLLACGLARLLLFTVPAALPDILSQLDSSDAKRAEEEAWRQYAEVAWRPGKPNRERWTTSVRLAREAWHGIES